MHDLAREYASCPSEQLLPRLKARLGHAPRCAVTRYVLGCYCFDHNAPATGVRHLMVAHHAEPQFESAALLVFTGLNWVVQRHRPLLTVVLETWHEFRRPAFDRYRRERRLLDAFMEPDPGFVAFSRDARSPAALRSQWAALAQLLWRLPVGSLRAQIRAAVVSPDADISAILVRVGFTPTLPST